MLNDEERLETLMALLEYAPSTCQSPKDAIYCLRCRLLDIVAELQESLEHSRPWRKSASAVL